MLKQVWPDHCRETVYESIELQGLVASLNHTYLRNFMKVGIIIREGEQAAPYEVSGSLD